LAVAIGLFLIPHRRREGRAQQQAFRRQEAAGGLAPGFLFEADQQAMAQFLKRCRRRLDVLHLELEPSLRGRNIARPGIAAETGLRRLRQRLERERLGALKRLGMQIAARFLLEYEAEIAGVKLAA
jgi:hypothetical protein